MEKSNKVLHLAFAVVIFCFGIFYMKYNSNTYLDMLKTVRIQIREEELYQQGIPIREEELYQQGIPIREEVVSGGALVAMLFQVMDYDIKINDTVIRTSEHEVENIHNYNISNSYYKRSYKYDEAGKIIMIVYASVIN